MKFTAVAFFCDDIREESAGTNSLMGIWPDYINLLPGKDGEIQRLRLGLYVRTNVPVGETPEDLEITLWAGTEVLTEVKIEADFIARTMADAASGRMPNAGFINRILAPNFPVSEPVVLTAVVASGGTKSIAGAVSLSFVTSAPTASPPPSEQSPRGARGS